MTDLVIIPNRRNECAKVRADTPRAEAWLTENVVTDEDGEATVSLDWANDIGALAAKAGLSVEVR